MPCCAKVPRHHYISATPQVEIGISIAATADNQVGRSLNVLGGRLADDVIEPVEKALSQAAGEHGSRLGLRTMQRSDEVTTASCGFLLRRLGGVSWGSV